MELSKFNCYGSCNWYNCVSYNFSPIEKGLTFHNVIILIKSIFNMIQINHYYNIFSENSLYEHKFYTQSFKWMFVYYKCNTAIQMTFLKELMLIRQMNQKNVGII